MGFQGPNVAQQTIVCSFIFTFLAAVSLSVHVNVLLFVRNQKLGLEDWLTVIAFTIALALVAQTIWAVTGEGQGKHLVDVTYGHFGPIAKSLLVNEELWAFVNTLIRISALITIKNIFAVTRGREILSYVVMILSSLHGLSTLLVGALVCQPLNATWDSNVQGSCINQTASFVALEAIGLAVDVMILLVPFLVVPRLRSMSHRRKSAIILLLSAGVLVTIITGLRIGALYRVDSLDLTYDQAYLGLLSILGALISIITMCIPSFAALYNNYLRKDSQATASESPSESPGRESCNFSPRIAHTSVIDGDDNIKGQTSSGHERFLTIPGFGQLYLITFDTSTTKSAENGLGRRASFDPVAYALSP
ncbi:hypothetical protein F4801DRAFT_542641 [Xylaria longipes]|nr:hypothetical protein F4801DRAFT_542641 [Xylaria longipes]